MTDPTPSPEPAPGLLSRFVGIIFSPGPTMKAALRQPSPYGILFVATLVLALASAVPQMTASGQQAMLDMQVSQGGANMSDQQIAAVERMAPYMWLFTFFGAFVFTPIMALLFTALMWGIFNAIMGGTASFKEVLTVVAHGMVIMAVGQVVSAPIMMMQGTMSPAGPFNLGALVPMLSEESFLSRYLGAISVFTIWQTIVVAIGLAVLYRRRTGPIAIGLLIAYAAVTAVFVTVFRGLMGGS